MHFHYAAENISVLRESYLVHRFLAWERLESELAEVSEVVVSVFSEGKTAVPHSPIMAVAIVLVGWADQMSAAARR